MPSIFQLKLIGAGLLVLVAVFFVARYKHLEKLTQDQADTIAAQNAIADQLQTKINQYYAAQAEYQKQIQEAQNENATLRQSVDSGATKLRVKASCPSLPKAADSARTEATAPELDREVRQDYFDLRQGIIELESRLKMCVNLLEQ